MSLPKKLQLKEGQTLRTENVPEGVVLEGATIDAAGDAVLVFVKNAAELDSLAAPALEAARADRLAWIAYPKGGKLGTDLNRDILWAKLRDAGVRPVRQVSIDGVWSALRFRPA